MYWSATPYAKNKAKKMCVFGPLIDPIFLMTLLAENYQNTLFLLSNVVFDVQGKIILSKKQQQHPINVTLEV